MDRPSVRQPVAVSGVAVVIAVDAAKLLHLLHDLDGVLFYQVVVGQELLLLRAAVQLRRGQDMGDGAHAMEQHGDELDEDDGEKEEHKHDTDRLQMQVLFRDQDLKVESKLVKNAKEGTNPCKCSNLLILCDGNVFLDAKWPVDVEGILVQREHEYDQNEERVEDREEEDCLVSQLHQALFDISLKATID